MFIVETLEHITEAHFSNKTDINSDTEKDKLIVQDKANINIIKEQLKCDCNDTDVNLQKQNCEPVISEAINSVTNDTEFKNITADNCEDNVKGERNQAPVKQIGVSSDTIQKYVYKKNEKENEVEKIKGHFKNSLRKRRSPVPNNPQPFANTNAPLIVNYETSHGLKDVEIPKPQNLSGNNVKNSALADFSIETRHKNKKDVAVNDNRLELQETSDSIEAAPNKYYRSNNDKRNSNKNIDSSSSHESEENSRSDENDDSTETKVRQEYNDGKIKYKHNLDSREEDNIKYRKKDDYESSEESKENNESKEFGHYKNQDNAKNSEENEKKFKTSRNENQESRESLENENYNKESLLREKSIQADSNSNESSEDEIKMLNKKNNAYLNSKEGPKNKNISIQDVDLDNFSYERIKVNKDGKVEPVAESHEKNSEESDSSVPSNPKIKSEKYNELNFLSDDKGSVTSSSIENKEPTHINDGDIRPVVEINSDIDSVEIIGEKSSKNAELNNENASLETLLGVKEKEVIEDKNKLEKQEKAPEKSDVKQEFERIPLDYKHDNKNQDENTEQKTPEVKEDTSHVQTESNGDVKNQGTLDAIAPKDEKFDEHLNFKFDDIAIKLPDIKLPEDILDYAYEEPVYERNHNNKPIKERFYHYKDHDSYEEEPKKNTNEEEDKESDDDYYSDYYGNNEKKQDSKAKKNSPDDEEDEEDEDLYEKFVRERFGKKGSFQNRAEKLQILKEEPNAQLYKTLQNVLKKTKNIEKEAQKSGDPKAGYLWTLEYGQNA